MRRNRRLSGGPVLLLLAAALLVTAAALVMLPRTTESLPQYTARSSRTCDNCHMDPTDWENPSYFERQCTMSCSGCHVDPTGGGMRTVSGSYFGIQTLSAFGATRPPDDDWTWHFLDPAWEPEEGTETSAPTSQPTSQPTQMPSEGSDLDDEGQLGLARWGTPLGGPSPYAFEGGRYGGLNADPVFAMGADLRVSTFINEGTVLIFPMQLDLSLLLHPVEHLSLLVEGGAWGSQRGPGEEVAGEDIDLFGLHEAFLMTHEWPANAYLKAGRFQPPFGTRLDDHTAPVRRELGLDSSRPSTYVSGVEIGAAPNYPYANLAFFQLDAGQTAFVPGDTGTGFSGVAGWRDLAWGAGGSFYSDSPVGRDPRVMAGVNWYFNPWRFWETVPLTYMGEVDLVFLDRPTRAVTQMAAFHELDFAFRSGLYMRLRYDFFDPDLDVTADEAHRLNLQFDLFPIRFTELQLVARAFFPAGADEPGMDFLAMLRVWY